MFLFGINVRLGLLVGFLAGLLGGAETASGGVEFDALGTDKTWRYWDWGVRPPDHPEGVPWTSADYDDADSEGFELWNTGLPPFGFGDQIAYGPNETSALGGAAASLDPVSNTDYFRHTFVLPEGADLDQLNAVHGIWSSDDGFVVYLNGTELFRINMPRRTVEDENAILASATSDARDDEFTFPTTSAAGETLLRPFPQKNVFAFEIHNATSGSGDLNFGPTELVLQEAKPEVGTVRPGVVCRFDRHLGGRFHVRPFDTVTDFSLRDSELEWLVTPWTVPYYSAVSEMALDKVLPSPAFQIGGGEATFDTEWIDCRSFKDVRVSLKLQTVSTSGSAAWPATSTRDRLRVDVTSLPLTHGSIFRPLFSTDRLDFVSTELVPATAAKRVVVPTGDTVPLNVGAGNWRTVGFDDSSWLSGTGGAGFDTDTVSAYSYIPLIDPALDLRASMSLKTACFYMRVPFSVADKAAIGSLILSMKFDDGFVAYINDIKAAEYNYQPLSGAQKTYPPYYNSSATTDYGESNALSWKDFSIAGSTFDEIKASLDDTTENGNVLAIYSLNASWAGSDILCLPKLTAWGATPDRFLDLSALDDSNPSTYASLSASVPHDGLAGEGESFRLRIVGSSNSTSKLVVIDDIEITGTPVEAVNYDAFTQLKMTAAPPGTQAPEGDADGDSVPNVFEFLAGADPMAPALAVEGGSAGPQAVAPQIHFEPDGRVTLRFRLPADGIEAPDDSVGVVHFRAKDIEVAPEISHDGVVWRATTPHGEPYFRAVGDPEPAGDGTGSAWVTLRSTAPLVGAESTLLVRFRATELVPGALKSLRRPY